MYTCKWIIVLLSSIAVLSSYTSAFFLNWGSPEPSQQPSYFYYQRKISGPSSYNLAQSESQQVPVSIPAVPMQVPMQAQLSSAPSIQNVQLVPCLCPIAQDYEYDKTQKENIYINANIPNNLKPTQN